MAPKIPGVILDPFGLEDDLGVGVVRRLKFEGTVASRLRKEATELRLKVDALWTVLCEESRRSERELKSLVVRRLAERRKRLAGAMKAAREKAAAAKEKGAAARRKG